MPSRLVAVAFGARDPERLAEFWAALLGPRDDAEVGLRFFASDAERSGPNRMHLHLTSDSAEHQQRTVATALRLGATHLDVGQLPEEEHVVLADPEGNELCVIEPGNAYLAGTGFLGEVACDGSRDVGVFWSTALGWPLVWDRDGETAIQAPYGGTKVAWSGTAPADPTGRQRFELAADGDLEAEVQRLVGLGATRLRVDAGDAGGDAGSAVVLADPDGMELHLTPG
jgi:catechol 2,3-dioxygenase-like lactoylglutathione lyase family enzyme